MNTGKKQINKRNLHKIDIVLFIIILICLLIISSFLIKPKQYDTYDLSVVRLKTKIIKQEEGNSIDVLFAGNSESCYTFSPMQLWEEQGFTSYSLGSGGQRLCDTYAILYEAFKVQSPSVVVLETDSLFEKYPGVYKDDNVFTNTAERIFPILHYHSFYNQIELPQFILKYTQNRKNEKTYKGFQIREEINGLEQNYENEPDEIKADEIKADEIKPDDLVKEDTSIEDIEISQEGYEYLNKIKQLCIENNCELILVSAPTAQGISREKEELLNKWSSDNETDYVNLNNKSFNIGIDWTTDTYDLGVHINIYGSKKVNKYIGELLKSKVNVKIKTENVINEWNENYKNSLYNSEDNK